MNVGSQPYLSLGVPSDGARLLPVLARALDTGRGPARLMRLLRARGCEKSGSGEALGRLAGDKRLGLGKRKLQEILSQSERFVGAAPHQADAFVAAVEPLVKKHRGAADYRPGKLL